MASIALAISGSLLALSTTTGCTAQPHQPQVYRQECSPVINKAIISHSEFDIARYLWDGVSQFVVVTDHFVATQDGKVRKLDTESYMNTFTGNEICDKVQMPSDYSGPSKITRSEYQSPITQTSPNAVCGKIEDAEVVYADEYSAGVVIFDGTWTKELVVKPILSSREFGAIVVSNEDFLRYPKGTTLCVDSTQIERFK